MGYNTVKTGAFETNHPSQRVMEKCGMTYVGTIREHEFRFDDNGNPVPCVLIGENGKVKQIKLQVMELGEPDASGRRRPVEKQNSEFANMKQNLITLSKINPELQINGIDLSKGKKQTKDQQIEYDD